jgi:pimeloyl-ACP methyl ester carboxylesterase
VKEGYMELEGGRVFFRKSGNGHRIIVALHGFGQDGRVFSELSLPTSYCMYAIDLPWHGRTLWQAPFFSPSDLGEILGSILCMEPNARHFEALGFSYGAGLWLSVPALVKTTCSRMFLLSPEAAGGRWQSWTSGIPQWLRRVLGVAIRYPAPLLFLAGLLVKTGLLHTFALRFMQHHLELPERRQRLFRTWVSMANFPVNTKRLIKWVAETPVPVHLFLGEKDLLLRPSSVGRWAKGIPGLTLHILPYGHQLIERVVWEEFLGE